MDVSEIRAPAGDHRDHSNANLLHFWVLSQSVQLRVFKHERLFRSFAVIQGK